MYINYLSKNLLLDQKKNLFFVRIQEAEYTRAGQVKLYGSR